jgi:hypothetical protein
MPRPPVNFEDPSIDDRLDPSGRDHRRFRSRRHGRSWQVEVIDNRRIGQAGVSVARWVPMNHWDELLRLAASLKFGHATASLLVGKLFRADRQNSLAAALKEYGALRRSVYAWGLPGACPSTEDRVTPLCPCFQNE